MEKAIAFEKLFQYLVIFTMIFTTTFTSYLDNVMYYCIYHLPIYVHPYSPSDGEGHCIREIISVPSNIYYNIYYYIYFLPRQCFLQLFLPPIYIYTYVQSSRRRRPLHSRNHFNLHMQVYKRIFACTHK